MSEVNENPKAIPSEQTPIHPEILERFSKGDIKLGEGMMISGEGEDRKIILILKPNNPHYLDYLTKIKSATNLVSRVSQTPDHNNTAMNLALMLRRAAKNMLNVDALSEVNLYIEKNLRNFSRRLEKAPKDGPEREQVLSEIRSFTDLTQYITYLTGQKAFEAILPEQQTQQAGSKK